RPRPVGEEIGPVELIVPQKLVEAPVEFIRSGLGGDNNLAAHAVAVFGGVVIGDNLEFGDRVDGRLRGLRLKSERTAGGAGTVVHTVEQHVSLKGALAQRDE